MCQPLAPFQNPTADTIYPADCNGENPMIELPPFPRLGGGNHGWLAPKFHFPFAAYPA